MLFSHSGAIARYSSYHRRGRGYVLLNDFQCVGNESNLLNCSHAVITVDSNHDHDVGVECPGAFEIYIFDNNYINWQGR